MRSEQFNGFSGVCSNMLLDYGLLHGCYGDIHRTSAPRFTPTGN